MTKLYVFNPEHDLVLAEEKQGRGMTPPRAARLLRRDLGFLPAFVAGDGDWVMVDDAEVARQAAASFADYLPSVRWVTHRELERMPEREKRSVVCHPWGWDEDVRNQLLRAGMNEYLMPSQHDLVRLRRLSHRASAIGLLEEMVQSHPLVAVGERREAAHLDVVRALVREWHGAVIKAPWSSSGRGVRFVGETLSENEEGFIRRVLEQQRSVIMEPHYECVLNFALEFSVRERRTVPLEGISIFSNAGAAYTGNLLASEKEKRAILEKHVDALTMLDISYRIHRWLDNMACDGTSTSPFHRVFRGPVGVDMMLVRTADGIRIHPCVEVNFRCTMGYIALYVERRTKGMFRSMAIKYADNHYSLILE